MFVEKSKFDKKSKIFSNHLDPVYKPGAFLGTFLVTTGKKTGADQRYLRIAPYGQYKYSLLKHISIWYQRC